MTRSQPRSSRRCASFPTVASLSTNAAAASLRFRNDFLARGAAASVPATAASVSSRADVNAPSRAPIASTRAHRATQLVKASFKDIFYSFVLMGWTAFGGPAAHIGIFQKAFVEGKRWMSLTVFPRPHALPV